MRAYIDADIIIWHMRGVPQSIEFLDRVCNNPDYELWISAMQRVEAIFFIREEEKKNAQMLLSLFKTEAVDQTIVDHAAKIYHKWHPSHGIGINDALLAASVINANGKLFTLNIKHFPMPELNVVKAW